MKSEIGKYVCAGLFDNPNASDYYCYFYDVIAQLKPKNGLEIGVGWGMSALAFLEASPEGTLVSVDTIKYDQKEWFNALDKLAQHHPDRYVLLFREFALPPTDESSMKVDWLYIDANHEPGYPEQDFEQFSPFLKVGGHVGFDDLGYPHIKELVDRLINSGDYELVKIESSFVHPNDMKVLKRIK